MTQIIVNGNEVGYCGHGSGGVSYSFEYVWDKPYFTTTNNPFGYVLKTGNRSPTQEEFSTYCLEERTDCLAHEMGGWINKAPTDPATNFMDYALTTLQGTHISNQRCWIKVVSADYAHYLSQSVPACGASLVDLNVSEVTDMNGLSCDIWNISSSPDLSKWDTSKVTNMNGMFGQCDSFNGNISAWDVSNVENMYDTFYGASSFNGDLSKWDVSSVTDMGYMFDEASEFNGDLSKWNTSSVEDFGFMFEDATSFNGNISTWDT